MPRPLASGTGPMAQYFYSVPKTEPRKTSVAGSQGRPELVSRDAVVYCAIRWVSLLINASVRGIHVQDF